MALKITKADVWHGEIPDQPGGLDGVLGALADAGASLEFVIARRQPEKPQTGMVFVTPVKGRKVQNAAKAVGLSPASNITTVRIEGANRPGAGHKITRAIANAGINMRGLSGAVIGNKYVAFLSFDNVGDANQASKALKAIK